LSLSWTDLDAPVICHKVGQI